MYIESIYIQKNMKTIKQCIINILKVYFIDIFIKKVLSLSKNKNKYIELTVYTN
jgi:hypothetical protein